MKTRIFGDVSLVNSRCFKYRFLVATVLFCFMFLVLTLLGASRDVAVYGSMVAVAICSLDSLRRLVAIAWSEWKGETPWTT